MNWQAIRTWAMANLRTVIFIAGIILLLGYLLFGGSSPESNIPGGGFGTLIVSALLFWGYYKSAGTGSKVLGIMATLFLLVWAWPRFFPFLNEWGFAPNLLLILAVLAFIWMWKGGKGLFAWRMFLFIFLVVCWLGARGAIFKDSFNAFVSATGIEFKMPDFQIPETLKNVLGGLSGYAKHTSAQKISQSKERLVKNGAKFYDYDGAKFAERKSPSTKDEFIKVFILDEQVTKDGLTFEKIRIGDPAMGEDVWVYSGILLTSPTASTPKADPTGKLSNWEKVEEKVVDFSQLEVTPITQGSVVGEIPLSMKKLEAGQYRVKLSGGWAFFMSNNAWTEFPWQGNNRLAGRPEFRPEQKMNFGAIILSNNGENITPVDEKGLQVSLSESSKISIRINVLLGVGEFYSPKIGKPVFKNSTVSPLTITIEKEVKS